MGWSFCGKNTTTGEEMGYGISGICHKEGCGKEIDHGLSYVCGSMHEGGERGCGYYFCEEHLNYFSIEEDEDDHLCVECYKIAFPEGGE